MRTLLFVIAMTGGCSVLKERPSEIVRKAEHCGAGDIAGASTAGLQEWFSRHRECAVAVEELCRPVRESAPAGWTDSTEGRVCAAAGSVAVWIRKPNTDHERFQAGWK